MNLEHDSDDYYIPIEALPNLKLPKPVVTKFGTEINVIIQCLKSPSSIYIMIESNYKYLKEFSKNLNICYNGKKNLSPMEVSELPLYSHWCVSHEKVWYRVQVMKNYLNCVEIDKNKICFEMLFVDFGFTKLVNLEDIQVLDMEFSLDPPFALPCYISQVTPLSGTEWTKDALNFFFNLFLNVSKFKAVFIKEHESQMFEIVLETEKGAVVNEEMVINGYAESTVIKSFLQNDSCVSTVQVEECKTKEKESMPKTWNPMLEDYIEESNMYLENSECAETVLLGVQNNDETNICSYFKRNLKCPREEYCKYLHLHPSEDGLPTDISVTYYCLEKEFNLEEMDSHSRLSLVVSANYDPDKFYCQFSHHDNIMDELQMELEYVYSSRRYLQRDTLLGSPGELKIVYHKDGDLAGYYRVRILKLMETKTTNKYEQIMVLVFYIDLGIEKWVKESQLDDFMAQFLTPPSQAMLCRLEGIRPVNNDWNEQSLDYFKKVTSSVALQAFVIRLESDDRLCLRIVNPLYGNYSVNELMVKKGFAVHCNTY